MGLSHDCHATVKSARAVDDCSGSRRGAAVVVPGALCDRLNTDNGHRPWTIADAACRRPPFALCTARPAISSITGYRRLIAWRAAGDIDPLSGETSVRQLAAPGATRVPPLIPAERSRIRRPSATGELSRV